MKRQIYNIKTLKEKKFHTLSFSEQYAALFGNPQRNFVAMCYGESGSGKSVFLLKFADYFARNFGKVLYNSHEEGVNQTVVDRINNFDIGAPKLFIANALNFDEMCNKIEKNYYRLVIIDSTKYMNFTFAQLKELRTRFAKRQIVIIIVDFGKQKGSPQSGVDLLHASDVKMFFKNGAVNSISRYLPEPANKTLFVPKRESKYPTLF
ncbi:MAG: DNA repair protein RadA [Bacteroidetes bacterium]|nr:DNA repair protein RadA [Bacteroidota bacterium]